MSTRKVQKATDINLFDQWRIVVKHEKPSDNEISASGIVSNNNYKYMYAIKLGNTC